MHPLCRIMLLTNHRPQRGLAPTRTFATLLVSFIQCVWVLDSLSVCGRHTGDGVESTKRLCLCRLISASFCVDTVSTSCVKSYKGFLLHTLLANCIKAFGFCCLSPCVCTSIKRRERQHVDPVPDIIYPAWRDARMQKPEECDGGICLSSPVRQTQPDRKFMNSPSLFSLLLMK